MVEFSALLSLCVVYFPNLCEGKAKIKTFLKADNQGIAWDFQSSPGTGTTLFNFNFITSRQQGKFEGKSIVNYISIESL